MAGGASDAIAQPRPGAAELVTGGADADEPDAATPTDPSAPADDRPETARDDAEELTFGAQADVSGPSEADDLAGRAHSTLDTRRLREQQERSLPEALRFEPGVSVQQTAHGQASPYVRGMTGQQVVHLFDGVRLNNAIYRQGPNQYFFTVDSATIARVDVLRGGASTRYGSDALGGVLLATPRSPDLDRGGAAWRLDPAASLELASADRLRGGRLELEWVRPRRFGVLMGFGYRRAGLLRAGGVVDHLERPSDCAGGPSSVAPRRGDCAPWVARFAEEREHPDPRERSHWRTQLGTGYRAFSHDVRLVRRLSPGLRLVAANYGFRERDAPRTDQCPAPEAPQSECLKIARQFRELTLLSLRGRGAGPIRDLDLTVSYQRHLEERVRSRPLSRVRFDWSDRVDTLGLSFRASTPRFDLGRGGDAVLRYGAQAYRDGVRSRATQRLTDLDLDRRLSRGQYLDRSTYGALGAFAELSASLRPWLRAHVGGRGSVVGVRAPGDPESGTRPVHALFPSLVGRVGISLGALDGPRVHLDLDPGFRAPNLDDLTSRQQVGPGFQFENASLKSERALTTQVGFDSGAGALRIETWLFATRLRRAIQRAPRTLDDCPPETPECMASRSRFSLVNLPGEAWLVGGEAALEFEFASGISARATVSYARGQGPDASAPTTRVPLSRVPPLNGTAELRYEHESGAYVGGALRWASRQTRLAPADTEDARIPVGGTPGYAVLDLRAGVAWSWLRVSVVVENVFDAAYRVHGSSINGPGLGARLGLELRPLGGRNAEPTAGE